MVKKDTLIFKVIRQKVKYKPQMKNFKVVFYPDSASEGNLLHYYAIADRNFKHVQKSKRFPSLAESG